MKFLFLSLVVFLSGAACAIPCEANLLPDTYFEAHADGRITFNGRGSARVYPLEFTLMNLGLSEANVLRTQGNVVLLGEGYGRLLPLFVRAPFAHVVAIDPIYGLTSIPPGFMGRELAKFQNHFAPYLNSSSASALPMVNNSVDFIYSHLLINNFVEKVTPATPSATATTHQLSPLGVQIFTESIRVLKVGGKAAFAASMSALTAHQVLCQVLETTPDLGSTIKFRILTWPAIFDYSTFGDLAPDLQGRPALRHDMSRIEITKIK